jgi:hypothetical protein
MDFQEQKESDLWEDGYKTGITKAIAIVTKHKGHGDCIDKILKELEEA